VPLARAHKFVGVSGTERQRGDLQEAERNGGEDKKSSCFAKDRDIGVSEEESKCALQVHHVCEYGSFHSAMSCVRHLPVSLPAFTEHLRTYMFTSSCCHLLLILRSFVIGTSFQEPSHPSQNHSLAAIEASKKANVDNCYVKISIKLCSKGFDTILVLMTLENVWVHASSLTSSSTMLVDVRVYCWAWCERMHSDNILHFTTDMFEHCLVENRKGWTLHCCW
jgi:hypothetical protein